MTKYRIKAYFMHEHEKDAAQKAVDAAVIADAEWTPGYVMGIVDKLKIKSLAKKGLVISIVEDVASSDEEVEPVGDSTATPMGMTGGGGSSMFSLTSSVGAGVEGRTARRLPRTIENKTPKSKVLSRDARRAQFYVVRFHGSITVERRKELRKLRIKLLERLARNQYTVELKPSEVKSLAQVKFVDFIRLYTEDDTLRVADTPDPATRDDYRKRTLAVKARKSAAKPELRRTSVYTVTLHQAKHMAAVVKWLLRNKRKPLWKHRDQLQVALVENSKTLIDLAKRPEVAVVEQVEAPRLCDEPARTLLGLVRKSKKLGLTGAGEIIGVADTGIDKTHVDLMKRIAGVSAWGRKNDVSDPEGHGTHVAGCAVGDGTASKGEVVGAAPEAKVFFQSILDDKGTLGGLPDDLGELFKEAYDKGARIHNNSWGAFSFAGYSNTSLEVDRFVVANPDMLVVIAAGNDGIGIPRTASSIMSAANGFVDWPSVAAPATAKNGLTVGASRSSRTTGGYAELTWNDAWPDRYPHAPISTERISSDDQCLAAFSSRGPSNDWRVKPDVVAPGTDIAAARSKDAPLHKFWGAYPKNKLYGFMGGTSMAAPYVAGCAALVREWYRKQAKWATPSAALLKATLINGTQRITGNDSIADLAGDPNFHQGFGRIDMSSTVPSPLTPKLKLVFDDTWKDATRVFTKDNQQFRYRVKVNKNLPLRICLTWTDPPGRAVQHILTLLVDNAAQTKWVGNAQVPSRLNIAGDTTDPNNNVQVVRIDNPPPGEYTIVVNANSLNFPPQAFALVVAGDLQSDLIRIP